MGYLQSPPSELVNAHSVQVRVGSGEIQGHQSGHYLNIAEMRFISEVNMLSTVPYFRLRKEYTRRNFKIQNRGGI